MQTNWKKNIILFISSQTLSLFGSALVQYAISWHITLTTQSGVMMTLAILCGFLPNLLLSPFAGVWADRYNRKLLIICSDSMIALATLALAIVFLLGYDQFALLFVILAIRSLGTAVQTPTVSALIPQIVPEDKLTKVNGINASIQAVIMLLAPVLSAALYANTPLETILFIDVSTAAVAVLTLLLFLKIPAHAKAREKQSISYFSDMMIGFRYIFNHSFLRKFVVFLGLFTFLAAPVAFLTPLQITRNYGEAVWRLTAIEMTFSIGMALGGLLIGFWGGFKNRIHTMVLACLATGTGTLLLGVVPNFWLYMFCLAMVGAAMPFFNTPTTVLIQETVEENFMGRVFGLISMVSSSMMPLGMLIFGPMADYVRIEILLFITGALMIAGAPLLLRNRSLIEAGRPKIPLPEE